MTTRRWVAVVTMIGIAALVAGIVLGFGVGILAIYHDRGARPGDASYG